MSYTHADPDSFYSEGRHTLAGNVRAEMARKRVNQTKLAAAMGKSQAYVSRRISGEVPMDLDDMLAITRYLGCDLADLILDVRSRCSPTLSLVRDVGQMVLPFPTGRRPEAVK